jgi:hypothetical protein
MRDAVKFFLDRMETNPEEFTQDKGGGIKHNWLGEINSYKKFFTEEEGKAVFSKIGNINLAKLKDRIVHKLLVAEQEEQEELSQASLQEAINKIQTIRQQQVVESEINKLHISRDMYEAMKQYANEGKL